MENFEKVAQAFLDFGITTILAILVVVLLVCVVSKLPKIVKQYADEFKAERKEDKTKYDSQMNIITKISEQSIQAQITGNSIMSRNNEIIGACMNSNERLTAQLEALALQSRRTEEATIENREVAIKAYAEAVKANERMK